jgi:hypothetical protein
VNAIPEEIGRDDIERKFRELQTDVVDTVGSQVRSYAIAAGAVLFISVMTVAYVVGRRRGRKRSTVVEIRRI